jgi:hypothetical protein
MSIRRRPAASIKGGVAQTKGGGTQREDARRGDSARSRQRRSDQKQEGYGDGSQQEEGGGVHTHHAKDQKILKRTLGVQWVGYRQEAAVVARRQGAAVAPPSARGGELGA